MALAGIVLALGAAAAYIALGLDPVQRKAMVRENGPIEHLSWVGYGVAMLLFLLRFGVRSLHSHWYIYAILTGMLLRELDAHKVFTSMGIFKSKFFLSPEVPHVEKLGAGLVIAFILWALYILVTRHLAGFLRDLAQLRASAVAVFLAAGFTGTAKLMLDGIGRKASWFGITLGPDQMQAFEAVEEVLELGIPVMLIAAILLASTGGKPGC